MKAKILVVVLLAAVVLAACGGDDGGADGEVIVGDDVTVKMFDNRFEFTEIKIPVGGSVTWVGAGRNSHNSVDADDAWSTEDVFGSLDQFEGDEAVITYNEAGEYTFFCTYHGNADGGEMAGVLIVE